MRMAHTLTARILAALAMTAVSVTGVTTNASARPTWDTSPVVVHRQPHPPPHVLDMRWGEHRNFDRVVIDLGGLLPGYRVQYVRTLTRDPSGEPVHLPGRRFIQIGLQPALAHDRHGNSTYTGPERQRVQLPTLRGLAFLGDFERVVSLGLSLNHRADFRVFVLRAPNRIIIDLHH
jgi:hypothetical protein